MDFLSWLPSFLGAGASAWGQHSANKANRYIADSTNFTNAQMAREAMSFSERMANTSWQRGMADMKAAGINPMLAISQGGASAPPGQSTPAQIGAPMQSETSGIPAAVSTALEARRLKAVIQNLEEDTDKKRSEKYLTDQMKFKTMADMALTENNSRVARLNAKQMELALPGLQTESSIDSNLYGKALRVLGRSAGIVNQATSVGNAFSSAKHAAAASKNATASAVKALKARTHY